MNWFQSLFNHNRAWLGAIVAGAAAGAAMTIQAGKTNGGAVSAGAVAGALTAAAGALAKSPLTQAIAVQTADNIAGGAPIGTKTLADSAEQVVIGGLSGSSSSPGTAASSPPSPTGGSNAA